MSWVRKRMMTPATVSQAESAAEMHLCSGVIPTATHVLRLAEEKGLWPEVAGPDQGGSTEPQDSLLHHPPIVSSAPWHKTCPPLLPRKSVVCWTWELGRLEFCHCRRLTHRGSPGVHEPAIWMPAVAGSSQCRVRRHEWSDTGRGNAVQPGSKSCM
jgi:hypothetical protein